MEKNSGLFPKLVDSTPVGIIVAVRDGSIKYINRSAQTMFNTPSEILLTKKIIDLVSASENEFVWEDVWKKAIAGDTSELSLIIQVVGDEDVVCKVTFCNSGDNSDGCETVALFIRDITHEVMFNDQINKKNIEMAKMNSELIRWNAELKRISELKSNFLSIASHELKTPLTSIKGYSDIIIDNMKDKIDAGIYRMIESISRAADRLHKVVNNILDVTRIEQKRLRLKPEMLDLSAIAKDCIDDLYQFSQKRGIVFKTRFSLALPQFYGDKTRMQQMFTNLFSNAIKFSPDGSTIEVGIEIDHNDKFHIMVADHGVGIDKNEQTNIFESFYEIGNANRHSTDFTKFMGGGTGLGLSIVKGIIERHHGKIWVESEGVRENEFPGSVFHILLPAHADIGWDDDETKTLSIEQQQFDDDVVDIEEITERINRKPVILFIDSDREAVEIARMVLENAFEVLVAETGELGLTLAFSRNPSVILLDTYLPAIDGYRVCRILRTQDETRYTPIAFFSAGTQHSEIQKCFSCGADDFIVKPFSGRELVDKIWRLLMKKKEENTLK